MKYKYGDFSQTQIALTKERMRKQIYFLLLIVDEKTAHEFENVDVNEAFEGILAAFGGLNDLLGQPPELVQIMSLLNAAYIEYKSEPFNWNSYRSLILDAGSAVLKIKEV